MPRKDTSDTDSHSELDKYDSELDGPVRTSGRNSVRSADDAGKPKKAGSWREIEARREKAALKASLADVWDEDFDLDEEILAELDHTAEYFTPQEDAIEEVFVEDDDEFYDDDEEDS